VTFDEAHRRIKGGDLDAVRSALDQGLSPSETNRFGWSLLMLAAIQGTTEIGKLLISSGAPIDSANDLGETALSLAAAGGHAEFVKMLMESGAPTECHPHGHDLQTWLRIASGLSDQKIRAILHIIDAKRYSQ
jgi:ankyrin repeat protein